jgi:hypothetical protein
MKVVRDVVFGPPFTSRWEMRSRLEWRAIQGDSPVAATQQMVESPRVLFLGNGAGIWEASTSNPKYVSSPIADKYREGTLKRTPDREFKDPETC